MAGPSLPQLPFFRQNLTAHPPIQLSESKNIASVHVLASRDLDFMPIAANIRKVRPPFPKFPQLTHPIPRRSTTTASTHAPSSPSTTASARPRACSRTPQTHRVSSSALRRSATRKTPRVAVCRFPSYLHVTHVCVAPPPVDV
jgi:hypothetical protein